MSDSIDTHADEDESVDGALADEAVAIAREMLLRSRATARVAERRRQVRLGRLVSDPRSRELVFALTDQLIRIEDDDRAADRLVDIVATHSTAGLGAIDRALLRAGARVAPLMPRVVMPLVRHRIRAEARGVILPAEQRLLRTYLRRRRAAGIGVIVNPLGEAILSDRDADARVQRVLAAIDRPDVDYVSIKISAIIANLDVLAFEHSVERIADSLRRIYRAAQTSTPPTFVNLDMEEYGDLDLSIESFMRVLDEPEFESVDAGIVLQAYIPDSHDALERLGSWAAGRRGRGGGRVKIRIVKGANLAMERLDADMHGWCPATYTSKAEVDASYKAMLDRALAPEWADSLVVGVASHNLFDIAWAYVAAREARALGRVDFEMLEGMAPAQASAVAARTGDLLLYAPVVERDDFDASIAYLARRLDENTQPDNFLLALFSLRPDTAEWHEQESRFRRSVVARHTVATNRLRGPLPRPGHFANEPDTDFTNDATRRVALAARPSAVDYTATRTPAQVDDAIERSAAAFERWSTTTTEERRAAIDRAADEMRRRRFETIATMGAETGKTIREADPEVSEAIDFARYYAGPGLDLLDELRHEGTALDISGRGTIAVIGPWNFPYAIPAGGVFASLCAGNSVVLKPAPEAVSVAAVLVDQLRRSGLDPDLVQLVVCDEGPVGRHLVTHDAIDTVVLTGSFDTAQMFHSWQPELRMFAETSGKNAMVITAAADLDLALDDLVRSAFGHAGQKCSAASLGIIEAAVYDDPAFHRRLRDIVESRAVGWPDDPATVIGPVISPPSGDLLRALTTLERGERWLVEPEPLDDTGRLWRPGVRVDVQPGSWFHASECFGPVLGLIRARSLDHAISIQNDSSYGLTGGIHTLDPGEIERWCERVEVGNCYVNRHVTGAVVQRQPFGGWKRSSVGPGTKAGGPNHLLQFSRIHESRPVDADVVEASYSDAWHGHFTVEHDPSGLASESNVFRYRPVRRVVARHDGSAPEALRRLRLASSLTGVDLIESDRREQSDDEFLSGAQSDDRVRLLGDVGTVRGELVRRSIWCDDALPAPSGRVELLKWTREQSISRTVHRHGRVPAAM